MNPATMISPNPFEIAQDNEDMDMKTPESKIIPTKRKQNLKSSSLKKLYINEEEEIPVEQSMNNLTQSQRYISNETGSPQYIP